MSVARKAPGGPRRAAPAKIIRRAPRAGIHVGLGSWSDAEYRNVVYPARTPPSGRLAAYARLFPHVEVNSTYYAVPKPDLVRAWARSTPADFVFHVKLHRVIAQSPGKAGAGRIVAAYLKAVQPLVRAGKFGVFLLVLPPSFSPARHELEELDGLIAALRPQTLAVELRDRAWVSGAQRRATLAYFAAQDLVWVNVDMPRIPGASLMPPHDEVTHPEMTYLRLHGRNRAWLTAKSAAERHEHAYAAAELRALARRVTALSRRAATVYVVANNHARDFAPRAALALQQRFAGGG